MHIPNFPHLQKHSPTAFTFRKVNGWNSSSLRYTAEITRYVFTVPAVCPLPCTAIQRHRVSFHIRVAEKKTLRSKTSSPGAISSVFLGNWLTVFLLSETAAISANPPSSQITHSENIPHFLSQKTCSGYHSTGWRAGGWKKILQQNKPVPASSSGGLFHVTLIRMSANCVLRNIFKSAVPVCLCVCAFNFFSWRRSPRSIHAEGYAERIKAKARMLAVHYLRELECLAERMSAMNSCFSGYRGATEIGITTNSRQSLLFLIIWSFILSLSN